MGTVHRIVTGILVVLVAAAARAELELPALLSEGMVLQRSVPIKVWGKADAGAVVTAEIAGQHGQAMAADDGTFLITLRPLPAGGPHELVIATSVGDRRVLGEVLVGEVWVCSGQSNMQWSFQHGVDNADEETAAAHYPHIRFFEVPRRTERWAQGDVEAQWVACSPQSVRNFSAAGYFFGRKLHTELGVPIGLIGSNLGGTPAESWTARSAMEAESALRPLLERWDAAVAAYDEQAAQSRHDQQLRQWQEEAAKARAEGAQPPRRPQPPQDPAASAHRPSGLYHAMIAPLVKYPIAGAIWYQGESNVGRAHQYRTLFPTMIRNWRQVWNQPEMPFYFVQIAPYDYRANNVACAELWEAQLLTMKTVPHTGMAVTNDIGDVEDIHPRNKQDVGHRLALWALAKTYGQKDLTYSGPIYKGHRRRGSEIVISFDHTGSGLATRDEQDPTHFAISGADQQFHPAQARIERDRLIVWSEAVERPVAVRFAWDGTAEPNLMNKEGLPAPAFRTDTWKLTTEGNH